MNWPLMSLTLTLILYNLLLPAGLLFMLPGALRKMRARGGQGSDLLERLGTLPREKQAALAALPCGSHRIWIHAVSVGEAGIAIKLVTRLLQQQPGTGVVITTTTPTGHAMVQEFAARRPHEVVVLYSPVDLPWVGARFLDLIQPSRIILVEAELWPNLVFAARRRGIPVSMVNARLSARSERRFRQFGGIIRPIFGMLDLVLVQEPADAGRLASIGVRPGCIRHTGSVKFDPQGAEADPAQVEQLRAVLHQHGIGPDRRILLLASTHNGEEQLLARLILRLNQKHRNLALLIVPRHVERTSAILAELHKAGLEAGRRSAGPEAVPPHGAGLPTLLVDTTGELRAWQCLADIVIVGKSFLAEGGQNPAEAVMAGKPVLFGPHMENFEALVDLLLKHQGAVQVADVETLERELDILLQDAALCRRLGEAGHNALQAHEGATEKTLQALFPQPGL